MFVAGTFIFTVNHEPRANFREDKLQEVVSKSCKPVPVQDHNLGDHAFECLFQKGLQAFPFEVDTGGDVFDENVPRVRFLEVGALAIKVGALLRTTDSCVDVTTLGRLGSAEQSKDTIEAIQALTSWCTYVFKTSGGRPVSKCTG